MRLYIIRHGQSSNNLLFETTRSDAGRSDDPVLTDTGVMQAKLTGYFLANGCEPADREGDGFRITHLYCSPMKRALHTASLIHESTGTRPVVWQDWHENHGIYLSSDGTGEETHRTGLSSEEMKRLFPSVVLPEVDEWETGWWNRPAENEDGWIVRSRRVLNELQIRHGKTEDRIAVVSHGGFYTIFLAALIGLETIQSVWFRLNNCAISRIDFNDWGVESVFLNYASHIPPELRS